MRILTSSFVLVLGLALAPAVAMAQSVTGQAPAQAGSGANNTVPVGGPGGTSPNTVGQSGSGANNSKPVGGPALLGEQHLKTHKRHHRNFYGKHHNYTKSSPAKGPTGAHVKTTGTE